MEHEFMASFDRYAPDGTRIRFSVAGDSAGEHWRKLVNYIDLLTQHGFTVSPPGLEPGEEVEAVDAFVLGETSNGDRCVYLYSTHHGLQYRVATVYVERFGELPFAVPDEEPWPGAAPTREMAQKKGRLHTVPAFEIVLEPTGKVTDAGRPVMRFARVKSAPRVHSAPDPTPPTPASGVEELNHLDQVDELTFDDIPDAPAVESAQAAAVERLWARLRDADSVCARMVQRLRAQEAGRKCSAKQYGFLVGLIDGLTQDGAHRALLHLLTGHPVDKEWRLSASVASKLISALNPDGKDYWAAGAECVRQLWRDVQDELGQGVTA